ncbi:hypothetical protein WH91_01065 [Devosia psychrophila]|uniref:ribonuclease H n=1 Tax=Devosia psychrophila TaxID=728005 RepID=A0ABR5E3R5_9HYPH|nr:hypothetical protein WH91_01065 [Devosia psychrophila]
MTDGSGPEATGLGGSAVGTGGHAAILQLKQGDVVLRQKPFAGQVIATATNSQMEMMAPLAAFDAMQELDIPVLIESDSQFLVDGMNGGHVRWQANGWKKSDGKPVKNLILWLSLVAADEGRQSVWVKVKGHSGHELNELADKLASSAKAGKHVDENGRVTWFPKGLSF